MYREYQANCERSLLQKFHCFAFAIARDTKSGGMAVLENFDRLQLCSFSQQQMFFPQGYARVYERACAHVHISLLWLFYNLPKFTFDVRANNTYVNPLEKIIIYINISTECRVMHIFWQNTTDKYKRKRLVIP